MLTTSDELLHVGVSQTVLTPPIGFAICGPEFPDRASRGVDDDPSVRCAVFSSYGETVAIVSLDVWGVSDSLMEKIAVTVEDVSGISRRNTMVVCTGNGTSPPLWREGSDLGSEYENYVAYLPDVVAGVVLDAVQSAKPAAVGAVTVSLPNLSCFERSGVDEELELERERLTLTAAQDSNGDIVCVIYSFACPATIVGDTNAWTADYPGVASAALEQAGIGTALFIQGASEDVRPFDWRSGNKDVTHANRTWEDAQAFGILLATQVIRAVPNVVARRNAVVKTVILDDGEFGAMMVGDVTIVSSRTPQPIEFASRLRMLFPATRLIVNANSRGCVGHSTNVCSMALIETIRNRIYP